MKKMILRKLSLLSFLLLAFAINIAFSKETSAQGKAENISVKDAKDNVEKANNGTFNSFAAYDVNGTIHDESIYSDHKLTMVNIWGTFCGPCLAELPDLGKISADYKNKGVQIVGLLIDILPNQDGSFAPADIEKVKTVIQKTGANYLHLLPSEKFLRGDLRKVQAVPTTLFFDSTGKQVGGAYIGSNSKEKWEKIIDKILTEIEK